MTKVKKGNLKIIRWSEKDSKGSTLTIHENNDVTGCGVKS